MKLNKLFVLLALPVFALPVFAGNTSSNGALIEQSVSAAASSVDQEINPQVLKNTQQALSMGLMVFDAHRDLNSMSDNDKAIEQALETQIPAILNKIKNTSDEVYAELEPAVINLTDLLLQNQTVYPIQAVDKESGVYMTLITAIVYAQGKGLLLGKVANILNMEMQSVMAAE